MSIEIYSVVLDEVILFSVVQAGCKFIGDEDEAFKKINDLALKAALASNPDFIHFNQFMPRILWEANNSIDPFCAGISLYGYAYGFVDEHRIFKPRHSINASAYRDVFESAIPLFVRLLNSIKIDTAFSGYMDKSDEF